MTARRRVGITQRRDLVAERDEWRDTLDVRLAALVWEVGFTPVPLASGVTDIKGYLDALDLDAFVLSGGGEVGDPAERAELERVILARSAADLRPVLGICRGMQVIVAACGGTLDPVEGHVATRHTVSGDLSNEREVNSFHTLGLRPDHVPLSLAAVARAPDGTVEAVRHRVHPWTAIMWHPEREHPYDSADLALFAASLTNIGRP